MVWRGSSYARPVPPVRRVVFGGRGAGGLEGVAGDGGERGKGRRRRWERRSKSRRREAQAEAVVCASVHTCANFEGGMREGGGTVIHRYAFQRRSFTTVGKWKEGKEDDAEKRAEKRVHEGSRGASTRRREGEGERERAGERRRRQLV